MKSINVREMKEHVEGLVLSMNEKCRKCAKFPFCNIEPKEDCREYKKRSYEVIVERKEK